MPLSFYYYTVIRVPNEFGFLGIKDSPELTLDLTKVLFNDYMKIIIKISNGY